MNKIGSQYCQALFMIYTWNWSGACCWTMASLTRTMSVLFESIKTERTITKASIRYLRAFEKRDKPGWNRIGSDHHQWPLSFSKSSLETNLSNPGFCIPTKSLLLEFKIQIFEVGNLPGKANYLFQRIFQIESCPGPLCMGYMAFSPAARSQVSQQKSL